MHKTLTTQKTAERKNDELTQYERLTTHAGVWAGHSNPTRKIPAPFWYRTWTWGGYADGGQWLGVVNEGAESTDARLQIKQKDKPFVQLLWEDLNEIGIVGAEPKEVSTLLKKSGKTHSAYEFKPFTLPYFTGLYHRIDRKMEKT
jgi:hypothetical protein